MKRTSNAFALAYNKGMDRNNKKQCVHNKRIPINTGTKHTPLTAVQAIQCSTATAFSSVSQ
eukprot:m.32060 g.32060  ORF g.32060 m.32060 type:complete len:61 (-) comp9750_c1_seq4:445-627(-)